MTRPDRIVLCVLLLGVLFAPSLQAATGKTGNSCVDCHAGLPGSSFVGAKSHSWSGSVHQKHGVTCDKCHGGSPHSAGRQEAHAGVLGSADPGSPVYFKNIPATCGKCHGAEFFKFSQSLHYRRLQSTGKGPECVTCHGSMVTGILTPDTLASVCEQCHNERMGIFPYIPLKAKAVLLLLKESNRLIDADGKLYHPVAGSEQARLLGDAQASLHAAILDWHKFDLDSITGELQKVYDDLERMTPNNTH